jgi:Methyltransferase domain
MAAPRAPAAAGESQQGRAFAAALDAVAGVEGWLSDSQARRLWNAARNVAAPGRIVEIGSFHGRSTIVLALAARPGVELVAIDPHLGGDRGPREIRPQPALGEADRQAFDANLARAGVQQRVRHVRLPSAQAQDAVAGELAVLYVDGAHRYAAARDDLRLWGGRVAAGGTLLVHDAFSSLGVTLALWRVVIGRGRWRYRGRSGSLAEYECADLAGLARTRGVLSGVVQLPWFARNLLVKALIVARMRGLARLLGHVSGPWPY